MSVPDWLDDAAGFATCATLLTTGSNLVGTGVSTLWAGGGGLVPLSLGMLSFLGAGAVCGDTPVDTNDPYPQVDGCQKASDGGYGSIQIRTTSTGEWLTFSSSPQFLDATEILSTSTFYSTSAGKWIAYVLWRRLDGSTSDTTDARFDTEADALRVRWRLDITSGTCAETGDDPKPLPPNFTDPVQYTNPTTNCTYNVTPQGFVQETEGGQVGMVFKIEAAGPQTLASGGVIGGCNFSPTLVYRSPNSPNPYTIPWDPTWPDGGGDGKPPWQDALERLLLGAAGSALGRLLADYFEAPYPATSKSIYAACQYKEDGSPEEFTINFPEQKYQDRVLDALTAQVDFAQQFHLWKSPICGGEPAPVTGEPVTLNWISDEPSPATGDRFHKRFVYFDQKGTSLLDTVKHWEDFSWTSGPVIVFCKGTALGKPEIWASSLEEGKRVINHAAAIAGVDITAAQWVTATPKSARYGLQGTMRIMRSSEGVFGITKRDGPSGPPPGYSKSVTLGSR